MAERTTRNVRRSASRLIVLLAAAVPAASAAQLWDGRDRFLPGPDLESPAFQEFGSALASCDWNGDGRDDLAVGAPTQDFNAGFVSFYLGTASGALTLTDTVVGPPGSEFGAAIACGRFRGDGTWQVAIGAPGFEQDGITEGAVEVYAWNGKVIHALELRQSLPGAAGAAENGDEFGAALASGDFNDDGVDDLAIGSPGENVGNVVDAGAVTVFLGALGQGLVVAGNQIWHKDVTGAGGEPGTDERVGEALAAFDMNCDTYDDLAVGIPGQIVDASTTSGSVVALAGVEEGIAAAEIATLDVTNFTQPGAFTPTTGDRFGAALASLGNYFGSTCGAIAIGAPGREIAGADDAGAIYLARWGQGTTRYYTSDHLGGLSAAGERFGTALAVADWDADGRDDLAIGLPGNDPFLSPLFGGIFVMLSEGNEPLPENARLIQPRSTLEMSNVVVDDGKLGAALAAGDFDGSGVPDLAAGTPDADTAAGTNAGGVEILFGALFAADFEGGNDNEWSVAAP